MAITNAAFPKKPAPQGEKGDRRRSTTPRFALAFVCSTVLFLVVTRPTRFVNDDTISRQMLRKQPRKLFVDLGANCGNSYLRIKNNMTTGSQTTLHPPEEWEAYLWECNPQLIEWFLNDLVEQEGPNVHLVAKAASTEDGHATFFMTAGQERATSKEQLPNPTCDPKSPFQPGGASTLHGNAKRAGANITVETVDFFEWHRSLGLQAGDTVHMKMDIEGAELRIIEKFLEDDSNQICYWENFWVEYHRDIFVEGSEDYSIHEKFEKEFPVQFEAKCGRKLWPNVYG